MNKFLDPKRCMVIGEVTQSHDGSLGTAHAFIDAIAKAGADAVKFQTHIAAAESTPQEPWRVKFSTQDASRYDYWKRMEFTTEQWQGLADRANEKGLTFLRSPFSIEAVDLLENIGMPAQMWPGRANCLFTCKPISELPAKRGARVLHQILRHLGQRGGADELAALFGAHHRLHHDLAVQAVGGMGGAFDFLQQRDIGAAVDLQAGRVGGQRGVTRLLRGFDDGLVAGAADSLPLRASLTSPRLRADPGLAPPAPHGPGSSRCRACRNRTGCRGT